MIVASHNIMQGLRLPRLIPSYSRLRDRVGLDVLCIQENVDIDGTPADERIAEALGSSYAALSSAECDELAIVYDRSRFDVRSVQMLRLPRTESLHWLERTYLRGGVVQWRFAQIVELSGPDGDVCIVNFHLQCGGAGKIGTEIRRQQLACIASELRDRQLSDRIAVCGDTNAFCWPWHSQRATLLYILEPLAELGARDPGVRATHYFGRQNEPKLTHKLAVALGRIGLDMPHRYDVISTNLPAPRRGHDATPDSDHDIVWAGVRLSQAARELGDRRAGGVAHYAPRNASREQIG